MSCFHSPIQLPIGKHGHYRAAPEFVASRHPPCLPSEGDRVCVGRQPIELRPMQAGKAFQLRKRPRLLKGLCIQRKRHRAAENPGTSTWRFLHTELSILLMTEFQTSIRHGTVLPGTPCTITWDNFSALDMSCQPVQHNQQTAVLGQHSMPELYAREAKTVGCILRVQCHEFQCQNQAGFGFKRGELPCRPWHAVRCRFPGRSGDCRWLQPPEPPADAPPA